MKTKYLIEVIDLEIWINGGNIIIINFYIKITPSSYFNRHFNIFFVFN